MSYAKQKCIQLHIITWISESGQLFDFNTKETNQYNNFKSSLYKIAIPKHHDSEHYYFLHQLVSAHKDEKHNFILERRRTCQSVFDFKQAKAKNYKLIGGFKVFMKRAGKSENYIPCIKIIQAADVQIKKVRQEEQKVDKQKPYLVVKSFTKGYQLKIDQIVKFGKTEFKVKELVIEPSPHEIKQSQILRINETVDVHKTQSIQDQPSQDGSSRGPLCKICYDHSTPENPLVSPCKCKGQIEFLHVGCLKEWLDTKLKKLKNSQEQNSNVYHTKELFCQICKEKLPKKIVIKGKEFILLNFMEQFLPFIALQNTGDIQSNPNDLMFMTFPDHSKTTIGRLDDNGMILFQNSVSRRHAVIRMQQNKKRFLVQDTDSKYGTLVYQKGAEFKLHQNIRSIEIGNTVFSFKIIDSNDYPIN